MFYVKDNVHYTITSTNNRIIINTSILTSRGKQHTSEVSEPFTESSIRCKGHVEVYIPNSKTFNTTLDMDNNFWNGLSPYLFVFSNVTIDHFNVANRGFYSCTTNVTTKSLRKTLSQLVSSICYPFLTFTQFSTLVETYNWSRLLNCTTPNTISATYSSPTSLLLEQESVVYSRSPVIRLRTSAAVSYFMDFFFLMGKISDLIIHIVKQSKGP